MEIIVGAIVIKDNKILMVKETKKECYGKWAFPAGHLEKNENVMDGARRETKEETGCNIQLQKVFPIISNNKNIIMIHFLADLLSESNYYDKSEIMETNWFELNQIKKMKKDEFRSFPVVEFIIKSLEQGHLYNTDIIQVVSNL